MTLAEKQKRIELYHKAHIEQKRGCEGCLLVHFPNYEPCWEDVKFIERNYKILFGDEPTGNLDGDNAAKAMELLSNKLEGMPDSSALIVSHDMRLAISFADIIIKINKVANAMKDLDSEQTYYGYINKSCVFFRNETNWTNGEMVYSNEEFESFLKLN